MAKVLTGHDIRRIIRVLNDAGIVCDARSGADNDVRLDLEWNGYWGYGRSGFDTACFLIRNVVSDAVITFLGGHDNDNGDCVASVIVRGC